MGQVPQYKQIGGVLDEDLFPDITSPPAAAFRHCLERSDISLFAPGSVSRGGLSRGDTLTNCPPHPSRLEASQQQSLQAVSHCKTRINLKYLLHMICGIRPVFKRALYRRLEGCGGCLTLRRQF